MLVSNLKKKNQPVLILESGDGFVTLCKMKKSSSAVIAIVASKVSNNCIQSCLSSYLELDEASRVVTVGLQRVLLVQGPKDGVGFVDEGLRIQAVEVEAEVVQQKLHSDL